jgi:hypothetical protein
VGLTVVSVAIGVVLAAAYHLLSTRLQKWSAQRKFAMVPLVTIGGFIMRLVVLVGVLVALGMWTSLNMLALCLAFVVVFTVLNGVWLYSLLNKRHGAPPPSAGASSVL